MLTKEQIRARAEDLLSKDGDDSYRKEQDTRVLDALHTMLVREEELEIHRAHNEREAKKAAIYTCEVEYLTIYRGRLAKAWESIANSAERWSR